MLYVTPDYYARFRCAAGRCGHTCCAGWEIDIDPETREKYRALSGPLGARMETALVPDPEPHFLLGDGGRCPFLNGGGLCDLILAGGEGMLCQICRDHPRFRSFLPGRTETGVGLCCEAAGRLVLSQREPVRLVCEGVEEAEDPEARALIQLRDALLDAAQDRRLPLPARMERLLSLCGAAPPAPSMAGWGAFLLSLERLDEAWTERLLRLRDAGDAADAAAFRRHMAGRETEYEQLLVYFLFRHFLKAYDDGDITSKAAFAVLSVRVLYTLGALFFEEHGSFAFEDQVELARMYSSEVEYSEENLDALFDALYSGDGTA